MLPERLTLAGTVTNGAGRRPVGRAVLALTRQSGEAVDTARAEADGRYEMPLPPNGRYVLTVVTSDGATAAKAVTVWGAARVVDVELPPGNNGPSAPSLTSMTQETSR